MLKPLFNTQLFTKNIDIEYKKIAEEKAKLETLKQQEEVDDIIYTIHAHVQDITGNQITLGPINVTIDNYEADDNIAPTGTIISPPSASTVSGTIDIEVNAYDNVQMGAVDFIIDGSAVASDTVPPLSLIHISEPTRPERIGGCGVGG